MPGYADPLGPPSPPNDVVDWLFGLSSVLVGIVVVGAAFIVISDWRGPTRSATRSHRLKWEARREQIAEAVAQEQQEARQTAGEATGHE